MHQPGSTPATRPRLGINVRWSPELASRLESGMPATVVAQVGVPPPLSRLVVLARSRAGQVSLAAAFIPTAGRGAMAVTPVCAAVGTVLVLTPPWF